MKHLLPSRTTRRSHESDNPPKEETSGQDQQLLAMVHETINAPVNHPSSDIDQALSVNRANTRTLKTSYIFTKAKTNLSVRQERQVLNCTGHKINIVGIDNHELTGLDVVKAASLLDTNQGKVIGMFNEYAFLWQRKLHPFTWPNGIFQDQGR